MRGGMQVQGGRVVIGPVNEAVLASMDKAGVFSAVQFGESVAPTS